MELAEEQGVELPSHDREELTNMVTVGLECESLEEYLMGFDITLKVLQQSCMNSYYLILDAITRAMYEVCEDAYNDGVKYLEVRFSPILHINEGLSLSNVMEAVIDGKNLAEMKLPMVVRIIVCGMRQLSPNDTYKLAELCWRYRVNGYYYLNYD